MVPVYKGVDRFIDIVYRPVTLSYVVCKKMEHAIAGYVR